MNLEIVLKQFLISNLWWLVSSLLIFFVITFFKKYFLVKYVLYEAKQRVHEGEVPRLGGLAIYLAMFISTVFFANEQLNELFQLILVCILPIFVITLIEDIFHNTGVKLRLTSLILTSILLLNLTVNDWPSIENLGIISIAFESPFFNFLFFMFCLVALANGCNFIDGMNGLLGMYTLGAIICCLSLASIVGDTSMALSLFPLFVVIILFLLFNFPWGKLFLGDSGAYLVAMILGVWVINFFGKHTDISSWSAILIFFYPIAEIIYSVIRKIHQKKSPFYPDRFHLHLKVFDLLNINLKRTRVSNNLTTIFLSIFWLAPPLLIPWVYNSHILIFFSTFMLSLCYISMNILMPNEAQKEIF